MNTEAKNAGIASLMSSQRTSLSEAAIMQPTMTSTPAVAALGTAETTGAKKIDSAKNSETKTEVRPVRPPAAMPFCCALLLCPLMVCPLVVRHLFGVPPHTSFGVPPLWCIILIVTGSASVATGSVSTCTFVLKTLGDGGF